MKKNYLSLLTGLSTLIGFTSLATSCSIHFDPQPPVPPEPKADVEILKKDVKSTRDQWSLPGNTIEVGFEIELSKQLKENEKILIKDCKFVSQIGNTFDDANLLHDYPAFNFFKDDNHLVLHFSLRRKNGSTPSEGNKCVFNIQIGSSENTINPFWINDLSVTLSNDSTAIVDPSIDNILGESHEKNGSLYIPISSDHTLPLKYSAFPMILKNGSELIMQEKWSLNNEDNSNFLSIYPNQTISIETKNEKKYLKVNFELSKSIENTDNFVVPGYKAGELIILAMLIESDSNDIAEYSFLISNWNEMDKNISISSS